MTWVRCRAGASFSGTFGNLCLVHPLQCFFFPPRGKGGGRGGFDGPLLPPPVGVRWQKPIKIGPCDASSLLEAPTMKVALTEVTGGHLVRSSTSFPCFPEKEKAGLEQHCLLSSPACHLAHFIQGADEGGWTPRPPQKAYALGNHLGCLYGYTSHGQVHCVVMPFKTLAPSITLLVSNISGYSI